MLPRKKKMISCWNPRCNDPRDPNSNAALGAADDAQESRGLVWIAEFAPESSGNCQVRWIPDWGSSPTLPHIDTRPRINDLEGAARRNPSIDVFLDSTPQGTYTEPYNCQQESRASLGMTSDEFQTLSREKKPVDRLWRIFECFYTT